MFPYRALKSYIYLCRNMYLGHELNELTRFDMKLMDTVPAGPQYCDQEGWSQGTGRHIHLVQ